MLANTLQLLLLASCSGLLLQPVPCTSRTSLIRCSAAPPAKPGSIDRRSALLTAAALAAFPHVEAALASGGATAGKTTSIPRAKTRYYGRVTVAVTAFEALGSTIEAGTKGGYSFFGGDDSGFEELKSAGYLLAVAFKIDGKIPPERIPQARAHKKLMKDLEEVKRSLGRKEDAKKAYAVAQASMNEYLDGVELPALGDERYKP